MIAVILSIVVFTAFLSLFVAIYKYHTRRVLDERFALPVKDTLQFYDFMWETSKSGIANDEIIKYAAISTALGIAIGFCFNGFHLAAILGVSAFVLGPRFVIKIQKDRSKRKFEEQYPRAMSSFSAAAKVVPIRQCFEHIGNEFEAPTGTVFAYIYAGLESKLNIYQAITRAAEEFDLPELYQLAESLQILDEIGAGENATALLDAVADEARFKRKHKIEIKAMFGELKTNMIMASAVPLLMFGYFLLDMGPEFAQALKTYKWIVPSGMLVLIVGWTLSLRLINKAAKTL